MSEYDGIFTFVVVALMIMKRWQNQVGKLIESIAKNFIHIFFQRLVNPRGRSVAL